MTALLLSAKKGHLDCLKLLLENKANIHHKNDLQNTALHLSAQEGHLACVKWLCQQKAVISEKNKKNKTAFHLSAIAGHLECVKYLLGQGADTTWQGDKRSQAIIDIVKLKSSTVNLVKEYLQSYRKERLKPWLDAAATGDIENLKSLFSENDINVNTQDEHGNTALHLSAHEKKYKKEKQNRLACVKFLVKHGAHTDKGNTNNDTPVSFAWKGSNVHRYLEALKEWFEGAQKGNKILLESLLKEENINVNARDQHNKTALLWSAEKGHLNCLKYLLQQGADLTWEGSERKQACVLANSKK